jgi:hypothetical protein
MRCATPNDEEKFHSSLGSSKAPGLMKSQIFHVSIIGTVVNWNCSNSLQGNSNFDVAIRKGCEQFTRIPVVLCVPIIFYFLLVSLVKNYNNEFVHARGPILYI